MERNQKAKTILRRNRVGGLLLLTLRHTVKLQLLRQCDIGERIDIQTNQIHTQYKIQKIDPHKWGQLTFDKSEMEIFNKQCWKIQMQKREHLPTPNVAYKNKLRLDDRPKCKA